jgi:hydrogenase maturation protein HypF
LAESVAPGLNEVGLMLAYSPLHHLLAEAFGAPLVATSGNVSGEPVLTEAGEVEARLGRVADAFLHHDRPIRRPADDSVFRRADGEMRPIRLGRGLAPVERPSPFDWKRPMLAVGSDLKNAVALSFDGRLVISPHIGDLGSPRGERTFEQVIADLSKLYRIAPEAVACDAHPGYRSSRWARASNLPAHEIYHHHAHASAWAGEYGVNEDSLVFAWDGAGYGEDGRVWGGEALLGRPGRWRRIGSLRPFRLPGGDRASREPWRCALSLCWETGLEWPACPQDAALLRHAWERGLNCPLASSAGRLFDVASALLGLCRESSFEGQAAMRLEAVSQASADYISLPLARDSSGLSLIDWSPLLPMLMDDKLGVAERGGLFHASLARAILEQAITARERWGVVPIGLTGGVFQNRLLSEQTLSLLRRAGFEARLPREIPANDAGLAFGQLVELAARLQTAES